MQSPGNIPYLGPKEAADFSVGWVWSTYRALSSPQGSPTKTTLLFFILTEAVIHLIDSANGRLFIQIF